MLTVLAQKAQHLKFLVNENSTTILTGVGVAGVAATAYLTGRASFKAATILELERNTLTNGEGEEANGDVLALKDLSNSDKFKTVWKLYILPTGVALTTIAAIIMAHKISAKRIAALTIASGISERALREYKEKVLEKFGEGKARDVRDEVAQDRITNNPANREVIAIGSGDVLCYDMYTGRYFTSTVEDIKRAENKINYELIHFGSASLSEFFDEIGLPATTYSDLHGWNANHQLEIVFSTTKTPDDRPCIAIDFKSPPIADYSREPYN